MSLKFDSESLVAANHAAINSLINAVNAAIVTTEQLTTLNIGALRQALTDTASHTEALLTAKSPKDVADIQAEVAREAIEEVVSYSRSVFEISQDAANQVSGLVQSQFADASRIAQEVAEYAAKSAPFGADVALAAVKQASDLTEAYVAAATPAKTASKSATRKAAAAS